MRRFQGTIKPRTMKKLILLALGLSAVLISFPQKKLDNTKSDKHQQVNGTKFFLVPPEGFVQSNTFQGFQHVGNSSSILVMEIPGPFSDVTAGFNAEGLKSQGVVLKNKEEIKVNGYEGSFMTTEQLANSINFTKYILVFGDENATYMVAGMYPEELTDLDEDLVASMLSVIYEPDLDVDPLSFTNFLIDTDNTKLKFAKIMSGSLLYTVDGKVPTESSDKTSFIIGQSQAKVQAADKKLTTINRLKGMPYNDLSIHEDNINPLSVDGITGYEIAAEGVNKTDGDTELIYHAMLYTDDGYYIFFGTAKDDFDSNLELFKQLTKSFKRK